MSARDIVKQAAKRDSLIVHDEGQTFWGFGEIRLEAPKGFVFAGEGLHEFLSEYPLGYKNEAWEDLAQRYSGLEPCEAHAKGNCEWCDEEG